MRRAGHSYRETLPNVVCLNTLVQRGVSLNKANVDSDVGCITWQIKIFCYLTKLDVDITIHGSTNATALYLDVFSVSFDR